MAARVYLWLGDSAKAVECWQKCLELNPRYAHAYHGLGLAAQRKGNHQQAADLFRKALELVPNAPEPQLELAASLIQSGKMENAIGLLQEHVRKTPDPASGFILLGKAYMNLNDTEKARRSFEAAVETSPDSSNAHYGLVTVYTRLGEKEKAEDHLAKFRELRGQEKKVKEVRTRESDDLDSMTLSLATAYTAAGRVCEGDKNPRAAERFWRRAADLASNYMECRALLARLYQQEGKKAETVEMFEQLAAIQPKNLLYWWEIGQRCAELGRFEAAERAFRKVCELAPRHAQGHAALARLYLQAKRNPREALAQAQTAVRLAPSAAHFRLLSTACERNGDTKAARAALEQAAALEPETPSPGKTSPSVPEKE